MDMPCYCGAGSLAAMCRPSHSLPRSSTLADARQHARAKVFTVLPVGQFVIMPRWAVAEYVVWCRVVSYGVAK